MPRVFFTGADMATKKQNLKRLRELALAGARGGYIQGVLRILQQRV